MRVEHNHTVMVFQSSVQKSKYSTQPGYKWYTALVLLTQLEQVADICPYGWGGSVYQLAADRRTLNILGMYGGCLSLA